MVKRVSELKVGRRGGQPCPEVGPKDLVVFRLWQHTAYCAASYPMSSYITIVSQHESAKRRHTKSLKFKTNPRALRTGPSVSVLHRAGRCSRGHAAPSPPRHPDHHVTGKVCTLAPSSIGHLPTMVPCDHIGEAVS